MRRATWVLVVVSATILGCASAYQPGPPADPPLTGSPGRHDSSDGAADLGSPASDLGATTLGCRGYAACLLGCAANPTTTQQQYDACAGSCAGRSTPNGYKLFNDSTTCALNACLVLNWCTSATDTSNGCYACQNDAIANLFGEVCSLASDCNVASCSSLVAACTSDLP